MQSKLILGFFLVSMSWSGSAWAGDSVLSLCNHNPDRAVYAATMRQMGGGAGWQSVGWYKVEPGKCLDQNLKTYVGKVYLHAQDEFGETSWGEGPVQFCVVDGAPFNFKNADSMACSEEGQKKVSADAVTVQSGTTVWNLEPNFSKLRLCNKNPDLSVFAAYAHPGSEGTHSKGWYEIAGGECHDVVVGKYTGPVSYFAKGGAFTWDGTASKVCMNGTLAFDLKNADVSSSCLGTGFEMVSPREVEIGLGTTTVDLERKQVDTTLKICNTTEKTLFTARAMAAEGGLWRSIGWLSLKPKECVSTNLGGYVGSVKLYGEWNKGEMYWGSGPFNFCVDRSQAFRIDDSTNEIACNSDIAFKMVPAFDFPVKAGLNTFNFQP